MNISACRYTFIHICIYTNIYIHNKKIFKIQSQWGYSK